MSKICLQNIYKNKSRNTKQFSCLEIKIIVSVYKKAANPFKAAFRFFILFTASSFLHFQNGILLLIHYLSSSWRHLFSPSLVYLFHSQNITQMALDHLSCFHNVQQMEVLIFYFFNRACINELGRTEQTSLNHRTGKEIMIQKHEPAAIETSQPNFIF